MSVAVFNKTLFTKDSWFPDKLYGCLSIGMYFSGLCSRGQWIYSIHPRFCFLRDIGSQILSGNKREGVPKHHMTKENS